MGAFSWGVRGRFCCSAQQGDDGEDDESSGGPTLPPLPADNLEIGVLPRVIRNLVERRAVVKKLLKKEKVRMTVRARVQRQEFSLELTSEGALWATVGSSNTHAQI